MKRLLLTTLIFLSILLYAQKPAPAPPPAASTPASEDIHQILLDRIDTYKKSVGIVVGTISPQGTRIYSYGKLAADSQSVPDGDSVFEIGSMTKVFTSLILADMVRRGEVSLDDPIAKYLPATVKVPERNGRKITLIDLATHSSGLPRMPSNFHPADPKNPYADYSVDQMYEFISGYTLTRDIGAQYEYSNLGAGLLGHALARRAGTDYETLVKTRILQPLKMTSTSITLSPEQQRRLAHGHNEMLQPWSNWDLPTLAGAGALRSTVNDVLKFLAAEVAANTGTPQTDLAKSMKAQLEPRRPAGGNLPPGSTMDIALAWHILTREGDPMVWHNGGTGGYHSFMGFSPKTKAAVVVLSNATNSIDDIGRHLLDARYDYAKLTVPKEHKEITLDAKLLDAYVGQYQLAPGAIMTIARAGDGLTAQITGQGANPIFPESETDFFLKVVDAQLTFQKNTEGKVSGLVLHQAGRDLPGKKMDSGQ